jgi:hypothetical protein
MKAILKFDLPDDQESFNACVKAGDMALVLWELCYNVRKEMERELYQEITAEEMLEKVMTRFYDLMDSHGINIDELTS